MKKLLLLLVAIFIINFAFSQDATFTASQNSGCAPTTITFKVTNTTGITSYDWDFKNGNHSSLEEPLATFATKGTYNVTLTVDKGLPTEDIYSIPIDIYPIPEPSFTYGGGEELGCAPHTVNYTGSINATHPVGISTWAWNFVMEIPQQKMQQLLKRTKVIQ